MPVTPLDLIRRKPQTIAQKPKDITALPHILRDDNRVIRLFALGKNLAVSVQDLPALPFERNDSNRIIVAKLMKIPTPDDLQIKQIHEVIEDVNEIVSTIATAVEEQSAATQEISSNVSHASQGIEEVNTNVAESSLISGQISKEISGVNHSAREMATSSSQVHISAQDLQKLAGRLAQTAARFKIPPARFNIGVVKAAHLKWRSRLEALLHGTEALKPEEVANHHQCAFGKWYDSLEGQGLKVFPAFSEVGKHHEKIHSHACEIVGLLNQGNANKATALMASFEEERMKLFAALDELYLV